MSESKIYVGNLPYKITEDELRNFFTQYGSVENIKLIVDFNTGRSKGFGFVTFGTPAACEQAVSAANGVEMGGRKLKVNMARENPNRGGRGNHGGFNQQDGF